MEIVTIPGCSLVNPGNTSYNDIALATTVTNLGAN